MKNKREILAIAQAQSALEMGCRPEDFERQENVLTPWERKEHARVYYQEPIGCNLVSYGSNIVASVREPYREIVREYLEKFEFFHCFETPNIHWLDSRLEGQMTCFMAEYFLPDPEKLIPLPCPYSLKVLERKDFGPLYLPQWGNALCASRKHLDMLGVGAYDGERLVGLAGCSADCRDMWQIGVDVLPEYRRQGIASALTSRLALETLARGKAPFYCCAWSNIRSARNAIKSGFLPAWAELTVKSREVVLETLR